MGDGRAGPPGARRRLRRRRAARRAPLQRDRLRRLGQQPRAAHRGRTAAPEPGRAARLREGRARAQRSRVARRPPERHRHPAATDGHRLRRAATGGSPRPWRAPPRCRSPTTSPRPSSSTSRDLASAVDLARRARLDGPRNVAPDGWISGDTVRALAGGAPRRPAPGAARGPPGRDAVAMGPGAHAARAAALHRAPVGGRQRPAAGRRMGAGVLQRGGLRRARTGPGRGPPSARGAGRSWPSAPPASPSSAPPSAPSPCCGGAPAAADRAAFGPATPGSWWGRRSGGCWIAVRSVTRRVVRVVGLVGSGRRRGHGARRAARRCRRTRAKPATAGDHQEPGAERDRDQHRDHRPDDPDHLEPQLEAGEGATPVGVGGIALHERVEGQTTGGGDHRDEPGEQHARRQATDPGRQQPADDRHRRAASSACAPRGTSAAAGAPPRTRAARRHR